MPRKKKHSIRARLADEYAHIALRVNDYNTRIEASLNHYARDPKYAFRDTQDEPLFHFLAHLEIAATCTHPGQRTGDTYDLTIYGEDHPDSEIYWKLRDVQVVDRHHTPAYREYRGKRIPVYDAPKGMGLLDKARGKPCWRGTIWAPSCFINDLLVLLGHERPLFVAITSCKIERRRWIQSVTVQTTDPAEE